MKTIPHIVEEKHLRLFHPGGNLVKQSQTPVRRRKLQKKRPARKAPARKAPVRRAPVKKAPARKSAKKIIKGRVTKKKRQSVTRRQGGNFKDIFSR